MTDEEHRRLDREVAEKVMGDRREGDWWVSPDGLKFDCGDGEPNYYSTEIGAAWRVVEHLKSKGYCIRLSNKVFNWCWWCYIYGPDSDVTAEATIQESTAPLAICKAALATLKEKP